MQDMIDEKIDSLLETQCWIIDILPMRVPKDKAREYNELEKEYLHTEELNWKFFTVLMKLRCYYNFKAVLSDGEEIDDLSAEKLKEHVGHRYLQILFEDALLVSDPDDMYMSLFNPSDRVLEIVKAIVATEGLCVWES